MANPGDSGGNGGVRNELGGRIAGSSVQAGVVHGDVHFHHATTESAPVVPRQLPGTVQHFTNRDVEQNALTALVDAADGANTISAIDGTAGIGKTTLALYWSHRVRDRFPDGQLYVNLRGFDPAVEPMPPDEALRGFLDALGVASEKIPPGAEARAALYRSVVYGRRMLVVLDNALSSDQVRPLLPGSPTCLVLVTSRGRLDGLVVRDGARRMTLDFLSTPEALELLASYLGQDRVDAEPDAVDELVQRCAHLPLALSVVAARAAGNPTFPLAALVDELRDEQDRLDALDIGDNIGLRAVFSWSYRALSDDVARMFRLLGLTHGPDISLGAVTALAGISERRARRLLDELGRVHLLEHYLPGRYRFHDLLHAYAAERAEQDEPDADRHAAVRRLLDWYLHTSHNTDRQLRQQLYALLELPNTDVTPVSFDAGKHALAWYDVERANLLAAIRQASTYGLHTHAWQLPRTLMPACRMRGDLQAWHRALNIGLAAARHLGDRQAEADTLYEIGVAHFGMRRYDDSFSHHQQALARYQEIADRGGAGRALRELGLAEVLRARYQEAIAYLEQASALQETTNARDAKSETFTNLGLAYAGLGRYEEAIRYYREALTLHNEADNINGTGSTLHFLAATYVGLGRLDEAVTHYRQAIEVLQQIGDRPGEAVSLQGLGAALQRGGDLVGARECWQQALAIFDGLGLPEADEVRVQLSEADGPS